MKDQYLQINQKKLLKIIGALGIALPILVLLINYVFAKFSLFHNETLFCLSDTRYTPNIYISSISHSYYTPAYPVFIGIIICFAIILFVYKGYPKEESWISDNWLTNIAAACAIVLVVLPTSLTEEDTIYNVHKFYSSHFVGYVHLSAASTFFAILAYMSFSRFTLGNSGTRLKKSKNMIFRICGFVMFAGLIGCAIDIFICKNDKYVFACEFLMLIAFGVSWLTKGGLDEARLKYIATKKQSELNSQLKLNK